MPDQEPTSETKNEFEVFRADIFVDVMNVLRQSIGEPVTAQLAVSIGRVILDVKAPKVETYTLDDELLGTNEAATQLGVSKQRIAQLAKAGKMPPVVAHLAATRVWKKSDIDVLVEARQPLRDERNQPKVRRTKYEQRKSSSGN